MALGSLPEGTSYREVPDCPGYFAGEDGSLWKCWTGGRWPRRTDRWVRVRGTPTTQSGHLRVCLRTAAGLRVTDFLHRVILTTFVGPCPDGEIGCHDPDPNPANCALGNLRWATPTANAEDCKRHGRHPRGSQVARANLGDEDVPEVFRLRRAGMTHQAIADRFGIRRALVTRVLLRQRYSHVVVPDAASSPVVGNYARGSRHPNAKLSDDSVAEMKRLSRGGWTQRALAKHFGVHQGTVCDILNGKYWSHVK